MIDDLVNIELSKDAINKVSDNFKWNIGNLSEEQKRRIVDILVEKVLVYYDDDWVREVEVVFRFNVDIDISEDKDLEPTSALDKIKNTLSGVKFFGYGAPGRDRTHANQGPRPCALPLSYGCMCVYFT